MHFYPLVSIVIPVYNGSNYVEEAIKSAINQTYKNIEIIVVNDGSTDDGNTEKIAKKYKDKIRYYSTKKNSGVATALNLAISKMNGQYFSWLSHDDVYYPYKISTQVEHLSYLDNKHTIIYGEWDFIDSQSKFIRSVKLHQTYSIDKLNTPLYPLFRGIIHGCSLLIPKACFEQVGLFDQNLKTTQDYDLWFKFLRKFPIHFVPQPLLQSRIHKEQISKNIPTAYQEDNNIWIRFMQEISQEEMRTISASIELFYKEMAAFLKKTPYKKAYKWARTYIATIKKKPPKTILFVAFSESIHTVRWVNIFKDTRYKIVLFPSHSAKINQQFFKIHFFFKSGALKNNAVNIPIIYKSRTFPCFLLKQYLSLLKKLPGSIKRRDKEKKASMLANLIKKVQPDLIHSLEFQNNAYLVLRAKEILKNKGYTFPKWAVSNWGSDLYYYKKIDAELPIIKRVLSECNYYASESTRDREIALKLGLDLSKCLFPITPNTVGVDYSIFVNKSISSTRTSERKAIIVKGYQTKWGRANYIVDALSFCKKAILQNFHIYVYYCSCPCTKDLFGLLEETHGLSITFMPSNTTHAEMLEYFSKARVYIGISTSDGLSTSSIEAASCGAFPIQTNTAAIDEWAVHRKNAFIVPYYNIKWLGKYIERALTDDKLVNQAQILNNEIARKQFCYEKNKQLALKAYEKILTSVTTPIA